MLNFREQLNLVKDRGCSVCQIDVANSCDCLFDFKYTYQEFEALCERVMEAYLDSENYSTDELAYAVNDFISKGYTIKEVCDMSSWELLDAVLWGVKSKYGDKEEE